MPRSSAPRSSRSPPANRPTWRSRARERRARGEFRATLRDDPRAGGDRAVSGLFLQGLLRNPLASPFVLGLSSGATLGLAVAMWLALAFGFAPFAGLGSVVPAFAGAMGTLAIVSLAGRRRGGLDPITLVLAGVVVSSVCGALLMLVHHLLPPGTRGDLVAWTMGRIDEQPDHPLLGGAAGLVAGA
ncbi:MAG: iron chelate uptake ABC transporter family permease subunit, partial [Phycisphaerales bacterium]